MAISYSVYSNGNSATKAISVDFVADYLASSSNGVSDQTKYFFKFITAARTEDNKAYGVKVVESLSDLVLNGENQRISGSNAAYSDIKSMIVDYLYDYVNGHDENEHGATVAEQKPMKFN
jgi:hypothetical protein